MSLSQTCIYYTTKYTYLMLHTIQKQSAIQKRPNFSEVKSHYGTETHVEFLW